MADFLACNAAIRSWVARASTSADSAERTSASAERASSTAERDAASARPFSAWMSRVSSVTSAFPGERGRLHAHGLA